MLSNQPLNRFKRITTSGAYYPEIDGIRFLCIVMVMLCHVENYVRLFIITSGDTQFSLIAYLMQNGGMAVFAFFSLSGYILSLPFLRARFLKTAPPSLKKYFLRRLTRLEPPYIIALVLSFVAFVYVLHSYTFNELFPHFLASLFYVHHIFYPHSYPLVLAVAWTLEVEMMFYITLPVLLYLLYKLPTVYRRLIMFLVILIVPWLRIGIFSYNNFLFANIPYFLAGVLVAEHIVLKESPLSFLPASIKPALLACLFFVFFVTGYSPLSFNHVGIDAILLYFVFILIIIDKTGYRFFANKYIATIGGMCYSIYLTHYAVISFVGRYIHYRFFNENFLGNLFMYSIIFLVPAFVAGAIFYLLIEQPAMKKNWWKRAGNKAIMTAEVQD